MKLCIRNGNSGFSLLELILVAAILAALAGLAVPYYLDYVGQSRNSVMRSNLHTLRKSLMEYRADTGKYPDSLEKLVPRYITSLPEDPEPGAKENWGYETQANFTEYTLDQKYADY